MKEIELSKQGWKNKGKYVAFVDDDIFDEVNQYGWTYHNKGYAYNKKMKILLHRFIWQLKVGEIPEGLEIEHWDENKLNCQISNLRLATRSENNCNRTKLKNNTSGVKGIYKEVLKKEKEDGTYKEYTHWRAQISKDVGKKTEKAYSKRFDYTDEGFVQAKNWIKQKSLELQGKFSIYNKPKK
jgi:hypothetical protein